MSEQESRWRSAVCVPFLQCRADDEFDVELIKEKNLCRQPAVEAYIQSGAGLKAPTNSLCK